MRADVGAYVLGKHNEFFGYTKFNVGERRLASVRTQMRPKICSQIETTPTGDLTFG